MPRNHSLEAAVASALGLRIEGALVGGEHGALRVRSSAGIEQVLKVFGPERASRLSVAEEMTGHLAVIGGALAGSYVTGAVAGGTYSLHPLLHCMHGASVSTCLRTCESVPLP